MVDSVQRPSYVTLFSGEIVISSAQAPEQVMLARRWAIDCSTAMEMSSDIALSNYVQTPAPCVMSSPIDTGMVRSLKS